ncbi:hypothetical protein ACFLT9_00975 [Acidobacteriota bacterium]
MLLNKMKRFFILAAAVFATFSWLQADSFSLVFQQSGTNNLFQNISEEPDQISALGFSLEKGFSPFSIFTQGQYSLLLQNPGLSLYSHDLGLDFLHVLSGKTALHLTAGLRGDFYRSDYRDFNSISLHMESSVKSYLSPSSILQAGYVLNYRKYRLSGFDYVSHQFSLAVDKHFRTQTTLKGEVDWGFKSFLHPFLPQNTPPLPEVPEGQKGKGHGFAHMNNPQIFFPEGRETLQDFHLQVLSFKGQVAQSISSLIGLKVSGLKQWTLSGRNPYTTVEEYYLIENPSYDRFSWSGYILEALITLLAPGDIQTELVYSSAVRTFPGIESLDSEGLPTGMDRRDRKNQFKVNLQKDFSRFSIHLSFVHIWNNSNDPFFKWGGNYLSAGIQWNMFFGK